jgi:hypothetical protein
MFLRRRDLRLRWKHRSGECLGDDVGHGTCFVLVIFLSCLFQRNNSRKWWTWSVWHFEPIQIDLFLEYWQDDCILKQTKYQSMVLLLCEHM